MIVVYIFQQIGIATYYLCTHGTNALDRLPNSFEFFTKYDSVVKIVGGILI